MSAIRIGLLFSLSVIALVAPAAARTYQLDATITDVTVYPSRALVSRSGTHQLTAGMHTLEIRGIPIQSIEDSFQVQAKGPAGSQILGVEIGTHFEEETLSAEVQALQKGVDAKRAEVNGIDDRRAAIHEALAFLKNLSESVAVKGGESLLSAPRIDVAGWKNTLGFLEKEHTRLNRELRNLEPTKKELQAELRKLQRELQKLLSQQRTAYRVVILKLELPSAGKVSVDVGYLTHGATWAPRYEARVSTATEDLKLAYGAEVSQRTGENWQDVKLALSTAQPADNQILPDLPPWYIDVVRPRPMAKRGGAGRSTERLMMAEAAPMAMEEAEVAEEMTMPEVAIVDTALSTEFRVARKQTIASNGEKHRVSLQALSFDAPLLARAVPKYEEAAFLTSRIVNNSELPLLPGALQVFRDGAFVGSSRIGSVLPDQTFDVSLGSDPRFTVEREYVVSKRDEGGFFSKKITRDFHYRINVKNFHQNARRIVVLDQVPISQDGRIEVELLGGTSPNSAESDPALLDESASRMKRAPGTPAPRPGTLAWEYEIPAGGERAIDLKFRVTHDAGIDITGL